MKKKIYALVLMTAMLSIAFAGCGKEEGNSTSDIPSNYKDLKEAYVQLQEEYDYMATYAGELERRVMQMEQMQAQYGPKMDQYMAEERAGNKVIIIEPLVAQPE